MEGKFNQFFFIWTKNQKIWIIYAWLFFFVWVVFCCLKFVFSHFKMWQLQKMFVIKLKFKQLFLLGKMYQQFHNFKIPNINIATYFQKTL